MNVKSNLTLLLAIAFVVNVYAHKSVDLSGMGQKSKSNQDQQSELLAASCAPATAQNDLDVNNVRTKIMNGGDMWWDVFGSSAPRYEIPKNSGIHALFASALWMGGIDQGGQLKVAAMTYRQSPGGNDFYPGPLDKYASIDEARCKEYDKHFKMTFKEVLDFANGGEITNEIANWPALGPGGQSLAPYYDANGSGDYDPQGAPNKDGVHDYPWYNLSGNDKSAQVFGDQTLFWVFNDVGNIHQNSATNPIGMEIQAQAFSFATNDAVNDMTFYRYKIINRSSTTLTKTYFGQWVDSDLGVCNDDFVGCDVRRGLGYTYNADLVDDNTPSACSGELGYGPTPPAVGLDFFQGPIADPGDGIDNDRDDTLDEPNEQIIMSKFVYFNNDATVRGDPKTGSDYYNYLSGYWRDGTPFTYGKNAYKTGGPICDFMFPDTSDLKKGWGTGFQPQPAWSEYGEGNAPADRRFLISAGAFTLAPGAVNYITIGAVWARATTGDNRSSILAMFKADDAAQKLFDKNFKTLDGPQTPDVTVQELDEEILLYLNNKPGSNNYLENYAELDDVNIIDAPGCTNKFFKYYKFEGYLIYQLKDATVGTKDLNDPEKARLIAQCDVKNNVTKLTNYYDPCPSDGIAGQCGIQVVPQASDSGIVHSFKVTTDAFATGDNKLVNHRQYFFKVLAYAYNNFKPYAPDRPSLNPCDTIQPGIDGQKRPCLIGRIGSDKVITAMPHDPAPRDNGTALNASYGDGVKLTRIEGQGNGGNVIDLTQESIDQILSSPDSRIIHPTYEAGRGPIRIKVIDPLKVVGDKFRIQLYHPTNVYGGMSSYTTTNTGLVVLPHEISNDCKWVLTNLTTGKKVFSDKTLTVSYEQIIPEWGISVSMRNSADAGSYGNTGTDKNGVLEATMTFADPSKQWLTGIQDYDASIFYNWIRSGNENCANANATRYAAYCKYDVNKDFQNLLNGTWSPYRLCGYSLFTPGQEPELAQPAVNEGQVKISQSDIKNTASVDIVITPDKSKWTRCPVLEAQDEQVLAQPAGGGGAKKLSLRRHASVDKDGNTSSGPSSNNPSDPNFIAATGMGWFPGYAINVETGERLNMAFSEDSWNKADNGQDMIWNPTSTVVTQGNYPAFGGRHYIYVFGHNSDAKWDSVTVSGISTKDPYIPGKLKAVPRYDFGRTIEQNLRLSDTATTTAALNHKNFTLADVMWVNLPIVNKSSMFKDPKDMPCEVKVRLRVQRSFKRAYTAAYGLKGTKNQDDRSIDTTANPVNNNFPCYEFSTDALVASSYNQDAAKNALDIINIVPNPYYAYSKYEGTSTVRAQLDNRVRITNLPQKCTVSIFTVNGTMVRKFKKDDALSYLDWDIKNQAQIPVASGLYIVHIDVPNVGEKVLKWFGVMRPIDLDSY